MSDFGGLFLHNLQPESNFSEKILHEIQTRAPFTSQVQLGLSLKYHGLYLVKAFTAKV